MTPEDKELCERLADVGNINILAPSIIQTAKDAIARIKALSASRQERDNEVIERCLAEFDVPVGYRPTGWREKSDALRQRSFDEVKAAIRKLKEPT